MHYFSYGSNMSSSRFRRRVPSARIVGAGSLDRHVLKFHKASKKDGSAKCDASETCNPGDVVYGVLFHMSVEDKPGLDRVEGLGFGYEQKDVSITLDDGTRVEAFIYYATNIDPALKPYDWYKEHVLRGAHEHQLPGDYVALIEAVQTDTDPDSQRREEELSIYR